MMDARLMAILNERKTIYARLAELDREELAILTRPAREGTVPLAFDDANRTIRWDGGEMKLSKNRYKFVKALYQSESRTMKSTDLEERIWEEAADVTMRVAFSELRGLLNKTNFPYTVENSKKQEWQEVLVEQGKPVVIKGTATFYKLAMK